MTKLTAIKPIALLSALFLSLVVGCGDAPLADEASDEGSAGHGGATHAAQQPNDSDDADENDATEPRLGQSEENLISISGPATCWRDSYKRGDGVLPTVCGAGNELDQGLCYPLCKAGFTGSGPLCWSTGSEAPYSRGVGQSPTCGGLTPVMDAGLCYKQCSSGYEGVGSVCWRKCPASHPVECGGLCGATSAACVGPTIGGTRWSCSYLVRWSPSNN